MRVLQLGKYYHPYRGGIETHLRMLCGELRNLVELDVIVCNTERRLVREVVDGVRVTRCPELARISSTSLCPTMALEISRHRYDVIHFHFPHPMAVTSYLSLPRRPPHHVVVTHHSDIVRQKRLRMFYQPIANKLLRRTTAIICTSPNYRESSRELTEHREKTHVIPLGVDLESFDRTPELDAASQRRREACGGSAVVLCVGRLVPYKGFDVLVRAMKDVDAILLIVGSGPEGPALKAMSRALGIAGRIRFLGDLDDIELRACYLASDVVAMTSVDRSEAFGLVQLEAMASERAIVNTQIDGSGVPWVSRDGETGLTVPPRDTDRLARALSLLLADEGLRRRFGRQGRLRVEREFTGRVMARKTFELYERLTRNDT